jgi:hypothetical protein
MTTIFLLNLDNFRLQTLVLEPEPRPFAEVIESVDSWLETLPTMPKLDIKEGPKDVFGDTCIVFGIPARFTNPGTGDFELFPYGYPGKEIWEVKFGISEYQAIREISQVIFFRHGDVRSGDFITLMPVPQLQFTGCRGTSPCNHWLTYMRNARRGPTVPYYRQENGLLGSHTNSIKF